MSAFQPKIPHNERVLAILTTPSGMMAMVSGLAALIWAAVIFLVLTRQQATTSTLAARLLIWVVGLTPVIAALLAPRAVVLGNALVDAPPLTGAALLTSQVLTISGLSLSVLIIASQRGAITQKPHRAGRGLVLGLLAIYASVAVSALFSGHGGFDRQLIVLPLAILALYLAPRIPAPKLIWHVRLILRIYIYGSLASLIIAPSWAFVASSSLGRDYFHIGGQLSGLTPHPNALGPLAATALIMEMAPVGRRRMWPIHVAAAAAVLLFAQSRTGVIAAVLGLMFLRSSYRSIRPMRWVGACGVVAATAAFVLFPRFAGVTLNAFSGNNDLQTLNGRTKVWSYAYDQFLKDPVLGFGPNLFDPNGPEAAAGAFPPWAGQAHNQIFQTLGESGMIGMVAMVVFLFVLLTTAANRTFALAGLLSAMVAIMLTRFTTEAPLATIGGYDTSFALLFFLIAVAITPLVEVSREAEALSPGHASLAA
jgi:O-antigen ligase